ncbi:MAG: dephospho-CoA kinase [Gammaproteobacteria bacterium]|nr:dephospho-CoA kinase [Gammaproteobacteria bacterium]
MLRVGVTGGIGSGKTALTDWLSEQGIVIVDADRVARDVVQPGTPALKAIIDAFGEQYLTQDGNLDRAAMRQLVFGDEEKRLLIESITHPQIREALWDQLRRADSAYVVLSSPLLLESGQSEMVDISVVVDVPEEMQIQRTMARDANDKALVEKIMAAQMRRQERLQLADIVVDNSGDLSALHDRAALLHETLLHRAAGA